LAWLLCAQNGELDEDEEEPEIPDGLGELSGSLVSFADFLRIDDDLLHVAAKASPSLRMSRPSPEEILNWVQTLSPEEKDGLLVRLVMEEGAQIGTEMLRRFLKKREKDRSPASQPRKRAVGELLRMAEVYRKDRKRAEAEKAAKEKARREAEEAARREKYLDALAVREAEAWLQVDQLISAKQSRSYEEAAKLLVDLRDVATRKGKSGEFIWKISRLCEQYAKRPSLLERMRKAGL